MRLPRMAVASLSSPRRAASPLCGDGSRQSEWRRDDDKLASQIWLSWALNLSMVPPNLLIAAPLSWFNDNSGGCSMSSLAPVGSGVRGWIWILWFHLRRDDDDINNDMPPLSSPTSPDSRWPDPAVPTWTCCTCLRICPLYVSPHRLGSGGHGWSSTQS